ncbi:cyclin-D5-1 [Ricinus communis]|uniref:B-like cyclin n=1 Tax=Ricinus communis TaxID=3988 RepID=B9R710_RICCO|nr:cyclin-D5-1 [Ricinus communis]EEF52290.1 cyclin d, putative [Ricinus communis]|eukprot:XP_002510103.1 cyclin-D5-1 [Ricinus communis]
MENESISELLCQESETRLEEQELGDDEAIRNGFGDLDREEEYVEMLVEKEISFSKSKEDQSLSTFDNWVKFARLEAITWILKNRAIFGFGFQTAYLSITYFDRFLSRRSIDREKSWAVKLLSVACLSLAAKMEEIKVPPLSNFQIEEYNFESKVIQRMELLVLNTLEWRMISSTPFAFLHYFIIKFSKEPPPSRHLVSRTVGLIFAVVKEITSMEHRPSVIAAAAALMSLDRNLIRKALECKIDSISPSGFLEIEDVFQCYSLMQKLEMEKHGTPTFVNSDVWPTQFRPMSVLENSSVTSAISSKRKRLAFSDSDQNYGLPDQKRHR